MRQTSVQGIPIKDVLEHQQWFEYVAGSFRFRFRILSFARLEPTEVDAPEKIAAIEEGAVWWLMKLELLNMSKQNAFVWELTGNMLVINADSFKFREAKDNHLCLHSQFAKTSGLKEFFARSL